MAETEKFDEMGQDWWNVKGGMAALHMINPVRFDYFLKRAGDLKGKRVLDIGCGGGLLSEEFAKKGAHVTGVDLSSVAIEAAKAHASEYDLDINYQNCSLSQIKEKDFDLVICAEILEHVDDVAEIVAEAAMRLKKGGTFFFATINKTTAAWFFAVFMAENVLKFVGKGTHNFDKFLKPSRLAAHLKNNGVAVKEIKGMNFDPLEWNFSIAGSTQVNYLGYGKKE